MANPKPSAFTEDDRKVLNQIPIILENITEKLSLVYTRTDHLEQSKSDRAEVLEMEKRIMDRLDILQDEIEHVEGVKADRNELAKELISAHESRIKMLETITFNLPELARIVAELRDWRLKTVAWAAGACSVVMGLFWMLEIILKK